MSTLNLRKYQQLIASHILEHPRCAIWADMGTGKTASTLLALNALTLFKDYKTLVIAPLRVAQTTWPQELAKWDDFKNLKCSVVTGTADQRLAALQVDADIYTINYENIPWLVDTLAEKWFFNVLVVDEATKLKGFRLRKGTVRTKALQKVAFSKIERLIELTGTPSPNGIVDLWGQMWFLDKGWRLGFTFNTFTSTYFSSFMLHGFTRHKPNPEAFELIKDKLQDVCLTVQAKDHFDLKEPIESFIEITLPPKAAAFYKDMHNKLAIELTEESTISAVSAAAKSMKCLQIANGAVYYNDCNEYHVIHDEKLNALESIIDENNGHSLLVAYHFKSDLERLLKRFPQGRHLDKKPQTLKDWNAGRIPLLFAHPESAGHGLNMQDGGNRLVFFSHWWDLEKFQQIKERIGATRQAQAGYDRPVFIYYIVAKDTIDELVIERRQTKRDVQELLLQSMKKLI